MSKTKRNENPALISAENKPKLMALCYTLPRALGYHKGALMSPEEADELEPQEGQAMKDALDALWEAKGEIEKMDAATREFIENYCGTGGGVLQRPQIVAAYAEISQMHEIWSWAVHARVLLNAPPSEVWKLCKRVNDVAKIIEKIETKPSTDQTLN